MDGLIARCEEVFAALGDLPLDDRIDALNAIRRALSRWSPMADEPVDCVQWVRADEVAGNDYNPNSVAPPEMELLRLSILADGYTQPIVAWAGDDGYTVVDGFHRHRVGREVPEIRARVHGRLPVAAINVKRVDRGDRIAATIRHNRARGVHSVDGMAEVVLELARRNWSDAKIARELGMEPDEVLRLKQISGLADLFADREFSEAWEA